LIKKKAIQATR